MRIKKEDLISVLELHFDLMIEFVRSDFFPIRNTLISNDIVKIIDNYVIQSSINKEFQILDVSSTGNIKSNSIFFLNKEINISLKDNENLLIITDNNKIYESTDVENKILIKNSNKVYHILLNQIFIHDDCHDHKDDF